VRQVHGEGVLVVDRALAARAGFPRVLLDEDFEYDALVTGLPGLALTVSTADCLPILIADPRRRAVAAVHAGWRSTVRRIPERALGALRERYGTHPGDCVAALGPGIRGCCYEVDAPVIEPLARALPGWRACVREAGAGRWTLDLAAASRQMLEAAGLDPDHSQHAVGRPVRRPGAGDQVLTTPATRYPHAFLPSSRRELDSCSASSWPMKIRVC
jgi:YfiH family protein